MKPEERREVRRKNLNYLKDQLANGRQNTLADMVDMSANLLSQYARGHRGIGEDIARSIECNLGLKEYALDAPMIGDVSGQKETAGLDVDLLTYVIDGFAQVLDKATGNTQGVNVSALIAMTYEHLANGGDNPDFRQLLKAAMLAPAQARSSQSSNR